MFKVIRMFSNEYSNDEKGNASIEYALIISMIVIIVFTIVSFSATLENQFTQALAILTVNWLNQNTKVI